MASGPLSSAERAQFKAIAAAQHAEAERQGIAFVLVAGRGVVNTRSGALVGKKNCEVCDEAFYFDPFKAGRAGKYCSARCRQARYYWRHRKEAPAPAELAAKCAYDGRPIPEQLRKGRETGRPALYCSDRCRKAASRRRRAGLDQ